MGKVALALTVGVVLQLLVLRVIWLHGFDQGADTSLCVGWHMIKDKAYAEKQDACIRTRKAFDSDPINIAFRRR